jgi:hypothetical protein
VFARIASRFWAGDTNHGDEPTMQHDPLEIIEIVFPGNQFSGEIIPALQELVETGTVRILDLAVISKDANGELLALEISDLDPGAAEPLLALVGSEEGMFSDEDFIIFGQNLEPNSTAALMIFENTWAGRFINAVHRANGHVVLNERIPKAVVEAIEAALEEPR